MEFRNTPVLDTTTEQAEQPITNTRLPAMVLKDYGVNPTIETTAEPTSTFAADVDKLDEAKRVFVQNLTGTLQMVART